MMSGSDEDASDDSTTPNQGETKSNARSAATSTATTTASSSFSSSSSSSSMQEREVYSFGQNSYGELGHGHTEERRVPVRIEFCRGKNIVCIATGNEHTALLSDTGVVYAAGYNDSGQCGTGNSGRVPSLQVRRRRRRRGLIYKWNYEYDPKYFNGRVNLQTYCDLCKLIVFLFLFLFLFLSSLSLSLFTSLLILLNNIDT